MDTMTNELPEFENVLKAELAQHEYDRVYYASFLSRRQREILALQQDGLKNTAIAQKMNVSVQTVRREKSRMIQRVARVKTLGIDGKDYSDDFPELAELDSAIFRGRITILAPMEILATDQVLYTALQRAGIFYVSDLYTPLILHKGRQALTGFEPRNWWELNTNLTQLGLPTLYVHNREAWAVFQLLSGGISLDRYEYAALLYLYWGQDNRQDVARRLSRGEHQLWPIIRTGLRKLLVNK